MSQYYNATILQCYNATMMKSTGVSIRPRAMRALPALLRAGAPRRGEGRHERLRVRAPEHRRLLAARVLPRHLRAAGQPPAVRRRDGRGPLRNPSLPDRRAFRRRIPEADEALNIVPL